MKSQLSTEEISRHFPAFIEPGLQQVLANEGRLHHFKEGDVIMDYGGYIRMLPLVLDGTIKISRLSDDGSELFLYYLSPGESCTMTFSCCMHDKQSEIRAVAEEDTTILALPPSTARPVDDDLQELEKFRYQRLRSAVERASQNHRSGHLSSARQTVIGLHFQTSGHPPGPNDPNHSSTNSRRPERQSGSGLPPPQEPGATRKTSARA